MEGLSSRPLQIIDTHQHLWDLSQLKLPWMDLAGKSDAKGLRRDFLMSDYLAATRGIAVVQSVYMEVNVDPVCRTREAELVLALCRRQDNPMARAVIGGDPADPGFATYVSGFARSPFVAGVRTVLHDPDRPKGLCLEKEFIEGCRLLGELGLSFDLCMRPGELMDAVRLVQRCPDTHFILDHCGNMPVTAQPESLEEAWLEGLQNLAQCGNVDCKISGIVVSASDDWRARDLSGVIDACLDVFGEERVCFGGDWPVCTLRTSYAGWVEALQRIVSGRSDLFRRRLFHDNARRIYGLPATL